MALTYLRLRQSHFQITLKAWFRGLDKAVLAVVAVLQFILTAIVTMIILGLALALSALDQPETGLSLRVAIVGAWQGVSFTLLRALREAAFMPRTRAFFDALPVTPQQKLRADLALALQSYSFLWLPILWVVFQPLAQDSLHKGSTLLSLAELAALSLCVNIALLRGAGRQALLALAALALFAFSKGTAAWVESARLGAAVAAGFALWRSYLPGSARVPAGPAVSEFADGIALRSGLVVPILANDLRSNLAVRVAVIAATLAGCLIVMRVRTSDASQASVVVFVAAVAAVALFRLPALIRTTLLARLPFLAGQEAFARRMRLAAYGIPTLLFAGALLAAWPFDRSGTAPRDALVFTLAYLLGVTGARAGVQLVNWFMPLACMVGLIVLSAMT